MSRIGELNSEIEQLYSNIELANAQIPKVNKAVEQLNISMNNYEKLKSSISANFKVNNNNFENDVLMDIEANITEALSNAKNIVSAIRNEISNYYARIEACKDEIERIKQWEIWAAAEARKSRNRSSNTSTTSTSNGTSNNRNMLN